MMTATVDQPVLAHLIVISDASETIPATLRYRSDDPFAVHLEFPGEYCLSGTDVEWVFGRDLLAAGMHTPSGSGDVHIWPYGPAQVIIELHAEEGMVVILLPRAALRAFLSNTFAVVPVGRERRHLNLDQELAMLLGEA
jgi:hypothetical protein